MAARQATGLSGCEEHGYLHWNVPFLGTEELEGGVGSPPGLRESVYFDGQVLSLWVPKHCDLYKNSKLTQQATSINMGSYPGHITSLLLSRAALIWVQSYGPLLLLWEEI